MGRSGMCCAKGWAAVIFLKSMGVFMRRGLLKNFLQDERRALFWLTVVPSVALMLGTVAVLLAIGLYGVR